MRKTSQLFFLIICLFSSFQIKSQTITNGIWTIDYNIDTKTANFIYKGNTILSNVIAQVKIGSALLKSTDYPYAIMMGKLISDNFGNGIQYTVDLTAPGIPTMQQIFYLYPDSSYFLTEVKLISTDGSLSSNYMAPVVTSSTNTFFSSADANNRMLFVPYDNDGFIQYQSIQLNKSTTSYEATAIFNGTSRNGLVIGSVEHDTWKTGINLTGANNQSITNIECYGGIAGNQTRDVLPHGSIHGDTIKSPKIFVGYFDDWRNGMNEYGIANVNISGKLKWDRPTPFGWNSWGGFAQYVNFDGICQTSGFIKSSLQNNNFHNDDNTVYLDLDSFWDNMTDDQLKQFVDSCKKNGQLAGIYWTPFCDWAGDPKRIVEGVTTPYYQYKSLYLYANGQAEKLDGAYCLDPTHPGTQLRMDYYLNRFHAMGIKYIKLDFLTNGALEADSYYDPNVTTGVQAYNEGMKALSEKLLALDPDMFITQSICPLFPAQYGHAKRIACDAWGSISDTEYTMNGLSYGWWLDNVYTYNDPDNIVLNSYSEGENRARVTSAVITGTYMSGDNFSLSGSYPGNQTARTKAEKFLTNPDINDIARMGKSFYPVRGYQPSLSRGAESLFMYDAGKYVYVVIFNYTTSSANVSIPMSEIGLDMNTTYSMKELWSGTTGSVSGTLSVTAPMMDAQVYKIDKGNQTGISNLVVSPNKLNCFVDHKTKTLEISCENPLTSVDIFSIQGIRVLNKSGLNGTHCSITMGSISNSCYLVSAKTAKNEIFTTKIIL